MEEYIQCAVGEEATLSKTIRDEEIKAFAEISGDKNPLHLDEDYARSTRFGGRIAHGMLVASLISSVLGTKLPGPGAIYLSQELRFLAPVRPGERVTARVKVTQWDRTKAHVTLSTEVVNEEGKPVISGQAKLLVDNCKRIRQ